MSNKNSDESDNSQKAVILHPVLSRKNELNLLKANKVLVYMVISLALVVVLFGFFLLPKQTMLNDFERRQALAEIQKQYLNPALSEEIKLLQNQLVGLISGSIESKLRVLEESIKSGNLSTTGMGVIHDLKNDVIVLKTYSKTGAGRLIATNNTNTEKKLNKQLMDEISQLKNLLYASIASCGLLVAAIAGVWYQGRYRLEHEPSGDDKTKSLPANRNIKK